MATITMATLTGATSPRRDSFVQSYMAVKEIDLAEVATKKGSAIAASDVIEALNVPAGTLVKFAGVQVVEPMTGTSTDATIDVGITGGDVDQWVDGFDLDGASAGDFAAVAAGASTPTMVSAQDTIDVLVATQTGTITGGKIRVFAEMLNVSNEKKEPKIAVPGS